MKSNYKKPEANFVALNVKDIIQTSNVFDSGDNGFGGFDEPVTLATPVDIFEG